MSTIEPNETEPPAQADQGVWPRAPINQPPVSIARDIPDFKRFNILLLIVLHYFTGGIYSLFWMMRQVKTANAWAGRQLVFPASIWTLAVIWLAYIGYVLIHPKNDTELLVRLVAVVAWQMASFQVRTALNTALKVYEGDRAYSGKVGTFFLSLFYMQYKINVYLKNQARTL